MERVRGWDIGCALRLGRLGRAAALCAIAALVTSAIAACGSSESAVEVTAAPAPSGKLTVTEVKKALTSLDTTWSPGGGGAVNVAAFARSILIQLPAAFTQEGLRDADKAARIDEAMAAYNALVAAKGERAAYRLLDNLQFVSSQGKGLSRPLTAEERAITPLLNGMRGSTLMFSHGDTPMWSWEIQSVSIVGPSTAKVTYTVAPSTDFVLGKDNPIGFKNSNVRYQKVLEFEHTKSGWRLAGWPNFVAFVHELQANVQPASLTKSGLGWWELGSAR